MPSPLPSRCWELAQLAKESGLDGVAASPWKLKIGRPCARFSHCNPGRSAGLVRKERPKPDCHPKAALENGSTHLVVGRPITQAADKRQRQQKSWKKMKEAAI